MKLPKHGTYVLGGLALALALVAAAPSARANVYATNIKINGALIGSAAVAQGTSATITYILNEPASGGVAIQIFSGATAVRTIVIAGGSAGTTQGLNSVAWDGKDDDGNLVPQGNYTVSISAASNGYSVWTQTVNCTNQKAYIPSGIAVNLNTSSPYYGRVMVANGVSTANNTAEHPVGIVKFNADGSEADEGQSDAGNPFRMDGYNYDSIRELKYGGDDRIYFLDWVGSGKIVACDMIMSTNQVILDSDLIPGNPGNWATFDITDPGTTNALAWLADGNYPTAGVWCWPTTNNGVADPNVPGINVLATGGALMPLRSGFGMMIDTNNDVFLGEVRSNPTDATVKLTCITNCFSVPLPNTDQNIAWQDGAELNSTFTYIFDVAIDSRTTPKYVSAVFNGNVGGMKIINAADGTVVTNINQTSTTWYIGTCFDAVGNVYAGNANHSWQVFSPPGPNQATTPAIATMQVTAAPVQPHLSNISLSGGTVTITFTGGASDPASAFTLLSSGTVNGTYSAAAGASITGSAGSYTATVPVNGGAQFYRIKR